MADHMLTERVNDVQQQLVREFAGALPPDTVERCLQESYNAFRDARVSDFVPLFVHRQTRSRLLDLARTTAQVA